MLSLINLIGDNQKVGREFIKELLQSYIGIGMYNHLSADQSLAAN